MNQMAFRLFTLFIPLLLMIGSIAGCNNEQPRSSTPSARNEILSKTTLLSTAESLAYGDESSSIPSTLLFSERGHGVAYQASKDGKYQIVHNGKAGKLYQSIRHVSLSPDGSRVVYGITVNGKKCMVLDGREGKLYDDVWPPVFSPDGKHIAYLAQVGDKSFVVVDDRVSSSSDGNPWFNGNPMFSADSSKFAYVYSTSLVVSDLELKHRVVVECDNYYHLVVNHDKKLIAVAKPTAGGQQVVVLNFDQQKIISEGSRYDVIEKLAFGGDGVSVAYLATKGKNRYVVINGKEELLPEVIDTGKPTTFGDKNGVGLFLVTKSGVVLYQAFERKGFVGNYYEEAAQLVYDRTGKQYAHNARKGKNIFVVVNGKKSPAFDMVIDPKFTPDGKYVVFRARQAGKRFVVVVDTNGVVVRRHPEYEFVYEISFVNDGESVAYGVKDGNQLIWTVEKL